MCDTAPEVHAWLPEARADPSFCGGLAQNIDLVIEGTGVFLDRAGAGKHLQAGAKKVRAPHEVYLDL